MILSTLTFLSLYGCQDNFVKDGPSIGDGTETNDYGEVVDENGNSVSTPNHDWDGDGYTENDGDCDDDNPDANPGMEEEYYDDLDANCDGLNDFDADQDGHISDNWGGDDCNDLDATINPGVEDDPTDGIDSDCDGQDDPRFIYYTLQEDFTNSIGASAMDVDVDGRVHVVFEDGGQLWYTNKTMTLGSWRTPVALDLGYEGVLAAGGMGQQLDGSVDESYRFHIGYTEMDTSGNLSVQYAYLPNVRSLTPEWTGPFELEGPTSSGYGLTGHYLNVDTSSDQLPLFAYYSENQNRPIAYKFNTVPQANQFISQAYREELDYLIDGTDQSDGAPVGLHPTLATGGNNMAYVVYLDESAPFATGTNPSTQHTSFNSGNGAFLCESQEVAEPGGISHAAAIRPDGNLCVAYQDMESGALMYGCQAAPTACETWTFEEVESSIGYTEVSLALEFTSNSIPYIAYHHVATGTVRVASKASDEWDIATGAAESGKDLGQNIQMAVDGEDRFHLTFFNSTDGTIWYAMGR